MQEYYFHGVPKNSSDMKSADALQQQKHQETMDHQGTAADPLSLYSNEYQRLVIVFRRGKYQEYATDSGRSISHQALKESAFQISPMNCSRKLFILDNSYLLWGRICKYITFQISLLHAFSYVLTIDPFFTLRQNSS